MTRPTGCVSFQFEVATLLQSRLAARLLFNLDYIQRPSQTNIAGQQQNNRIPPSNNAPRSGVEKNGFKVGNNERSLAAATQTGDNSTASSRGERTPAVSSSGAIWRSISQGTPDFASCIKRRPAASDAQRLTGTRLCLCCSVSFTTNVKGDQNMLMLAYLPPPFKKKRK